MGSWANKCGVEKTFGDSCSTTLAIALSLTFIATEDILVRLPCGKVQNTGCTACVSNTMEWYKLDGTAGGKWYGRDMQIKLV